MEININVEFKEGQHVTYDNKIGKDDGIVIGYNIRFGNVIYIVAWSDKKSGEHYACELKSK